MLQISLGQAYIATNQTDKGMAAFEKAISVAPMPADLEQHCLFAWRNRTYNWTAPTNMPTLPSMRCETQLRDVSLESLRLQDLAATQSSCSRCVGHKGWIEFKRGNTGGGRAVHPAGVAGQRQRR